MHTRGAPTHTPSMTVVGLAALFFAAELVPIHVRIGDERHSISFNELPLALGAVALAPPALVAAIVVGGGVALGVHRRQRGLKLAFNLTQMAAQAVIVSAVFGAVRHGAVTNTHADVALYVAVVVADAVSAILVASAIAFVSGNPAGRSRRVFGGGTAESAAKAFVAVAVAHAFVHGFAMVGIAGIAAGSLVYLTYHRTERRRAIRTA